MAAVKQQLMGKNVLAVVIPSPSEVHNSMLYNSHFQENIKLGNIQTMKQWRLLLHTNKSKEVKGKYYTLPITT